MIGDRLKPKTPDQVRAMRRAGLVVGETLDLLARELRPGLTTRDLDAIAEDHIRGRGATPSFMGYHGFPATLCVSVNDEVVHGIPGDRPIKPGDLVSIDCGAIVEGWHGDAAFSAVAGEPVDPADQRLVDVTRESMWRGIAALSVGGRLNDVGAAVEDFVVGRRASEGAAYGIVEDYVGHGIGRQMHEDPQVPNYRTRDRGPKVRAGLVVAVEPMLVRGDQETRVLDDEWTVVTADGARAAHFEHTVAVTDAGLWVLTALDGGRAELEAIGARCGAQD